MPLDARRAAYADHAARCEALRARLGGERSRTALGLAKPTSNLFRDRAVTAKQKLDVSGFSHVLHVDPGGWVDVEGMTEYEQLADACLARGVMPAVVPELATITIGGAAAGVAIEATSFKHGLVHETLLELEVLTGDGRIVTATPGNDAADLFYGFANSYGTLGYALRVRARTQPVGPYVQVEHRRFDKAAAFFDALARACTPDADFVDGVVFAPDSYVLNVGRFSARAPFASEYKVEKIYYRSLLERQVDYLTVRDYLWRWDTDWFWCSRQLGAQQPLLRRLYGRRHLNSRTYTRLMRLNSRLGLTRTLDRLVGRHRESVIQDVDIPIEKAEAFLEFHFRTIDLRPVWVCPIGATDDASRFPLYPRKSALYINFGFWDVLRTRKVHPPGHFNRQIEQQVAALGGIKSLYSESWFTREEFERAYGGPAWRRLKERYDPQGRLGDLYDKCVLRH